MTTVWMVEYSDQETRTLYGLYSAYSLAVERVKKLKEEFGTTYGIEIISRLIDEDCYD